MKNDTVRIAAVIVLAIALSSVATIGVMNKVNEKEPEKDVYEKANYYASEIKKSIGDFNPKVAIVLGTGAGDFINKVDVKYTVPYKSLNGFPVCTAPEHKGNFVFGTMYGIDLVIMQGRFHYYEGYTMEQVTLPYYVMNKLGAETVILTNAVGSLNDLYRPGQFVVVNDVITSQIPSPLIGKNNDDWGPRFTPMNNVYSTQINTMVKNAALQVSTPEHTVIVHDGIFIQVTGPHYESPVEVSMYHMWGADTVGMSSGCEAIVAKYLGMNICNINCITDMADSTSSQEEVEEMMKHLSPDLFNLLELTIKQMSEINL